MKLVIAVAVVVLLMALTALAVAWFQPTPPVRSDDDRATGWKRVGGAALVGAGAYAGGAAGTDAGYSLARGAGLL